MAQKVYPVVNSLNAGEVSPLIAMREDISKYRTACLTLENAFPLVEGGIKKVPGSYYCGTTKNNAKARLVPFQFSTSQGAFLELSAGIIRIWENDGLLEGFTDAYLDYNPATAYSVGATVLIGSLAPFSWTTATLWITAPYGQNNAKTVPITISVNSSDALSVTKTGASPNQGILIKLAKTTAASNAATAIQAAIRALTFLNSQNYNYVDLSAWTVTPNAVYYATPQIIAPTNPAEYPIQANQGFIATSSNQYDGYPFDTVSPAWGAGAAAQVIEIVTPYAEADLFALDCSTQSADVLWIFHPSYPPACVERLGEYSWTYSTSPPNQKPEPGEPAYRGTADVVRTGYSAIGQIIVTITVASPAVVTTAATSVVFQDGDRIYINQCSGMVELNQGEFLVSVPSLNGSGYLQFELKDPTTGTVLDSTGYQAYTGGGFAVPVVALFANAGDYPACGTFFQERLCVAGSDNHPTQINGSVQGDYPNFICDPNEDDYAFQFTLVSNKLDQILNLLPSPNALLLGTAGGVWAMAGSNGASLSQTNVTAAKQTNIGVGNLQPQLVNDSAIFISRSTRIVIFMVYNFVTNEWENFDLTRLNRGITLGTSAATSGVLQTAFQSEPYPIFWAVRADGQLIGLVFNKQDQVFAWFRVNMLPGGGSVESVAVISQENEEDQVAVIVNRTISGATVRYFEYFTPQELFGQLSNAFFVHCGQQWQGKSAVDITAIFQNNPCVVTAPGHSFSNGQYVQITGVAGMTEINQDKTEAYKVVLSNPGAGTFALDLINSSAWGVYTGGGTVMQVTNEVTGMSYLLGQSVVAVGDGAKILDSTVVAADTVTFPYYCNLITIGLPYEVTIQPTNPVLSTPSSTTRGQKQKLNRVTLSLYQSMGGQFGTDLNHMYDITYGPGAKGQVPGMSTREFTRDLDADWDDESTFYVTQNAPFPFTLRGLVMRLSYNPD